MNRCQIITGDCRQALKELPNGSVHCCITSPPYLGLRDYGHPDQIGQERTPEDYVETMVQVFREVKRVLRDDGSLWLNLGDSYAGGGNYRGTDENTLTEKQRSNRGAHGELAIGRTGIIPPTLQVIKNGSLKPKDLVGIPWRVAFALQRDGWWLRSEIIFAKRNCMPESVTDRPTKSHEQIFLLTKSQHYFYDNEAVKVPASDSYANDSRWDSGGTETNYKDGYAEAMAQNPKMPHRVFNGERRNMVNLRDVWKAEDHRALLDWLRLNDPKMLNEFIQQSRNLKDVWDITLQPYSESHFAVFPEDLIKPCILAGTSAKGCCPKCGAPWERVVESMFSIERDTPYAGSKHNQTEKNFSQRRIGMMVKAGREAGLPHDNPIPPKQTTGWQPTCDCFLSPENVTTVPATVLDCFGGSGTTGQVAIELGRRAILIELNPKYVTLIENRTHVTPGLPLA